MAKPKVDIPADKVVLYDRLIATRPGIDRKGKTMLYTSMNGHMFTYLSKEGVLGIRLSQEDKTAFEAKYQSPPFVQYGAVMRGYVTVPDALFKDTEKLKPILDRSIEFIKSLKPKPTKRSK